MKKPLNEFKKIYAREADSIFRFCLLRVSDKDQALDITQETFLRLWKYMAKDKEILNNRAFIFTIAHRLIIDWYRKKKSISLDNMKLSKEMEYLVLERAGKDSVELGAESRYLLRKLRELPKTFRYPVYLRFIEGLTPQEIGDTFGISANAASVRINRGLSELRKKTGYNKLYEN